MLSLLRVTARRRGAAGPGRQRRVRLPASHAGKGAVHMLRPISRPAAAAARAARWPGNLWLLRHDATAGQLVEAVHTNAACVLRWCLACIIKHVEPETAQPCTTAKPTADK
jgi:hypothetical protein